VASSLDGTVAQVDSVSGRLTGPLLPVGPAPLRIVAGPEGSILALSSSEQHAGQLTHVSPTRIGWSSATFSLGTRSSRDVLLAGNGGRFAVAAFTAPSDTDSPQMTRCRLAAFDLVARTKTWASTVCVRGESLFGLAVDDGAGGTVIYAGLWRGAARVNGELRPGAGAILAIDAATGHTVNRVPVAGVPEQLIAAPAPGGHGRRLYCVEGTPGPEARYPGDERWRLLGFDADTLELESVSVLDADLRSLTVAPDGNGAYAMLADSGRDLLALDLKTGRANLFASLPGQSVGGLAVTGDRIYAPQSFGSGVWAINRRTGQIVQTIPVGRHPSGLTLSGIP
jgi:hypothetical protein